MKKLFLTLLMTLISASVFADELPQQVFTESLYAKFPQIEGAKVAKAFGNFYSVIKGDEILFINEDLSVLITGDVIDLKTNKSMTNELRVANRPKFNLSDLNLKDAIKVGSGPDKLYVFDDPDCPYCRQLEKELVNLSGVTVYIFPFPLASLHPNAPAIAESIWCSKDRASTWHNYLTLGQKPVDAHCDNPIERNLALGQKYKLFGTPSLVFSDGTVIPGLMPVAALQAQIVKSRKK